MFDIFSSLSLSNLPALFLAGLIPFLIFAYKKEQKLPEKAFSSLFLLKELPYSPQNKKKLKIPPRFLLYLLALSLLCLTAAWPLISKERGTSAVLVDNSMSTSASIGSKAVLDALKEGALKELSRSKASKFIVYQSSPFLKEISKEPLSKSEAKSLISSLEPSFSSDSFGSALSGLLANNDFGEVISLSDKKIKNAASFENLKEVNFENLSSNIFIKDFKIIEKDSQKFIEASVELSSKEDEDVPFTLKLFSATGEINEYYPLGETKASLNFAQKEKKILFELPSVGEDVQIYFKLKIDAASNFNSILSDDEAFLALSNQSSSTLLLVSPQFQSKNESGLNKIKDLSLELISPETLASFSSEKLSSYKTIIFHKSSPYSLPKTSSMLILPPLENNIFPSEGSFENPSISSWSKEHLVMSYLNPGLLNISTAQALLNPPWANSVLNIEQGSILSLGESQGKRFIGAGFELLPFEGRRTPSASVLFLNLLNYLNREKSIGSSNLSGENLNIIEELSLLDGGSKEAPTKVKSPDLNTINLKEKVKKFELSSPGVYNFSYPSGKSKKIIANSFFQEESQTALTKTLTVSKENQSETKAGKKSGNVLWPIFAKIILSLLALDLIFRLFLKKAEETG